jgi:hypothetical protein
MQILLNIWLRQIINKSALELEELIQKMQDQAYENDHIPKTAK